MGYLYDSIVFYGAVCHLLPPDARLLPVVLLRPELDGNLQRLLAHFEDRRLRARLHKLVRQPDSPLLYEHEFPHALQQAAPLRLDVRRERRRVVQLAISD